VSVTGLRVAGHDLEIDHDATGAVRAVRTKAPLRIV